jgi:hypothetical protein
MTGQEFRKLLIAELAKLRYHETYYDNGGKSAQLIGHHYPSQGGVPTPNTCWSLVATVNKEGTVTVTVPHTPQGRGSSAVTSEFLFRAQLAQNPQDTTALIIRWLRTTAPAFRLLPETKDWLGG